MVLRRAHAGASASQADKGMGKGNAKAKAKATPRPQHLPKLKAVSAVYASKMQKAPATFFDLTRRKFATWDIADDLLDDMIPTRIEDSRRQFVVLRLTIQDAASYMHESGMTESDIEDEDEIEGVVIANLGVDSYKTGQQLYNMMSRHDQIAMREAA